MSRSDDGRIIRERPRLTPRPGSVLPSSRPTAESNDRQPNQTPRAPPAVVGECVMAADYEIGYGKPPPEARFRKGRPGNPRGRPKGTKNLKTDLQEELSQWIPIRDQGRSRRISKQRALIKSLIARALQGN